MCFVCLEDVEWEQLEWGDLGWLVRPSSVPEAEHLTVIRVKINPGMGHDFHIHPDQEELIVLTAGVGETWLEEERKELRPGDAAFIPKNTPHATFVPADADGQSEFLVVLGPSFGPDGYEAVDVADQEPWASLRTG